MHLPPIHLPAAVDRQSALSTCGPRLPGLVGAGPAGRAVGHARLATKQSETLGRADQGRRVAAVPAITHLAEQSDLQNHSQNLHAFVRPQRRRSPDRFLNAGRVSGGPGNRHHRVPALPEVTVNQSTAPLPLASGFTAQRAVAVR